MPGAARRPASKGKPVILSTQEQFQEKCEAVFRPELPENEEMEHFVIRRKAEMLVLRL